MPSASEVDPLLPRSEPSPEISWYGTARNNSSSPEIKYDGRQTVDFNEIWNQNDGDNEGDDESISDPSPRSVLSTLGAIAAIVIFFGFVVSLLSPQADESQPDPISTREIQTIDQRVSKILDHTPLIDGHNDLAIFVRGTYKNKIHTKEFREKFEGGGMGAQVDIPRLRSGRVGGFFWSAFVVCPLTNSDDFSDENYATSVAHTLSQIDLVHRLQAQYSSNFTSATVPLSDALTQFHTKKSIISPISIEGLHQVPQTAPLSTLRLYYSLGVRAATLTWNCHNAFADAALIYSDGKFIPAPYHRGGLTAAGREVIHEMNRLGMLVDISHTSYWTQKAVLSNQTSSAPVLFTHSSAFTLCQHPRNVHDDILDLVKDTESLVMINFSPDFISCLPPSDPSVLPEFYEKNSTLHQVARHVIYVGDRIGYDYVGFGSDFDGIAEAPRGLEGVDKFPDLVAELLKMGVSDENAAKVVGGNLLRVWRSVERVAKELQVEGVLEGEDEVSGWMR